ncbi:MAG: nucleotide exchange factor GrpE [Candidatus Heimdallarchaeota archaeon]
MKEVHAKKNNKIDKKKGETKEINFVKLDDANSELDTLRNELKEKTKLADEYLSRLEYLQADFENYKKMEARERKTYEMNATELLIKNLLPIIDSFEIAIELAKKNFNKVLFIKGIELIYSDFLSELGKDTVVEEHEKGYMLGSKVIRTSKVKVSKIENQLDET